MGRRLGQFMKTAGAASVASPAPVTAPVATVTMGGPPPGSNSTCDALIQRVGGASSDNYGG
jgi:hypothetical protein